MLILGIETSCDETAVSVVENGQRVLSNVVSSSLHLHKRYGGVIPEIATRYHVELINYVLEQALAEAKVSLKDIDLVACVYGPGLVGALLIGLSLAKSLSLALPVPLVGINHIQAHLYAPFLGRKRPGFPFVGMVVSGGHTNLFYIKDYLHWQVLGRTRDDAAGEAFDKVAKILKLGYPGGPVIEKKAKRGDKDKIKFPRSYLEKGSLDFSFSGLKTAVLYYTKDKHPNTTLGDVAASFQEAVVDVLVDKAIAACRVKKVKEFVAGGGVIANKRLQGILTQKLAKGGINVYFPEQALCQDNAAMVAGLGYQLHKRGVVSDLNVEVEPNLRSKKGLGPFLKVRR